MALVVENLQVEVEGKRVIKGVDLRIEPGEVVALMGPNGSGKSSLAKALMGHPGYKVIRVQGSDFSLDGTDLSVMSVDERAREGLMLSMQNPMEIPGVKVRELLLASLRAKKQKKKVSALAVKKQVERLAGKMGIKAELLSRGVNDGFSGGEKKKMEILQMQMLRPKYLLVDEVDSGLDIDALKLVAESIGELVSSRKTGVLIITHYRRILEYLTPARVLVMSRGRIVRMGGVKLVEELEKRGYRLGKER